MSVFAIGDIHGSYIALTTLLDKLTSKSKEHSYVFLGDYVNKGSRSREVIEYLIDFSKYHQCIFLRGNHEILMLRARSGLTDFKDWLQQGGDKTLESYHSNQRNWKAVIPKNHWQFLEDTLPYFQWKNNLFVHAGLEADKVLKKQGQNVLFWNKNTTPTRYKKDKRVFCGHTVQKSGRVANFQHTVLLDTFAWGGGWLTAMNVKSGKYYQTNNSGVLRRDRTFYFDES